MRLLPRRATFSGGIFLPENGYAPADRPIEPLSPPRHVIVPLQQSDEPPVTLVVSEGEHVSAGQCIGRGDNDAVTPVHAPFDGRVLGTRRVDTTEDVDVSALAIECEPDASETNLSDTPAEVPSSRDAFLERVADAGVVGFGCDTTATVIGLRAARARGVRHFIINGIDAEPGLTARRRLLLEFGDRIVAGAAALVSLLEVRRSTLVVDRQQRDLIAKLSAAARGMPVKVVPLRNKYPQAEPLLLVKSVLGREVPFGQTLLDAGVVVLDVATVLAVHDAVTGGRPMTHRVVSVTGDGAVRPGDYSIAVGTSLAHIVDQVGFAAPLARLIVGGPMSGHAVGRLDLVTTRRTHAITLLTARRLPAGGAREPRSCVRCGWCVDDCPVGLDPAKLYHLAEQEGDARARALRPAACIDCGVCSYVCPSQLPLADGIARLKYRLNVARVGAARTA